MSSRSLVSFTDLAASKAREALAKAGAKDAYIRFSVVPGCSNCGSVGYRMAIEEEPSENDVVSESGGVKFILSKDSVPQLRDTIVDYTEELARSGFRIENPNIKSGCNCGAH